MKYKNLIQKIWEVVIWLGQLLQKMQRKLLSRSV
nr:MAG TPA: hypothetical protein [Caudoviricetes sp.]